MAYHVGRGPHNALVLHDALFESQPIYSDWIERVHEQADYYQRRYAIVFNPDALTRRAHRFNNAFAYFSLTEDPFFGRTRPTSLSRAFAAWKANAPELRRNAVVTYVAKPAAS